MGRGGTEEEKPVSGALSSHPVPVLLISQEGNVNGHLVAPFPHPAEILIRKRQGFMKTP